MVLRVSLLLAAVAAAAARYDPTWDSLDSRPLPAWYDDVKVGIFLHWGVFSVPSFGSEWFWKHWHDDPNSTYSQFMKNNYPPGFTYADFAPQFTAELWNPAQWADLFARSGAKYVVLTSKHHEGYTLWPSKTGFSWNSMDVGPRRDLVGELAAAVRNQSIHFGLYHSLYEWYNPLYLNDGRTNRTDFVDHKTLPELYEIVNRYEPDVIWSDGDWERTPEYWRSKEFLAWLYNDSPVKDKIVVNDRWGTGAMCHHGGYMTCSDRYNPGTLQPRKWENAFTIDTMSWGLRREGVLADYLTIEAIVGQLITTVSCGGNVLINVGPAHDGTIRPIFEERLTQLGQWLEVNGEAIYSSSPWSVQNDTLAPHVWYTQRADSVYATTLDWPQDGVLTLGSAPSLPNCHLLGHGPVSCDGGTVTLPSLDQVTSRWAWVVKFSPAETQFKPLGKNSA